MTRSSKIKLIRFWTIIALAFALSLFSPQAGLWIFASSPVALMIPPLTPTCPCVGCCTSDEMPCSAQVTLADLANLNCTDCANFNQTYNVSAVSITCGKQTALAAIGCTVGTNDAVSWEFRCTGSNTQLRSTLEIDHLDPTNNTVHVFEEDHGAKPVTCTGLGTRTPPFSFSSTSGTQQCDASGASCTIVFP